MARVTDRLSARRRLLEGLTAESEFRRCKRDKSYFLESYWFIPVEGSEGGRTLFKLWDFQRDALDVLESNRRVVIAKTRQLGMTTLSMAFAAHGLLFAEDRFEVLVLSWREDIAQGTLGMVDFGFTFLPDWLKRRLPSREDRTRERITFRFADGRTTSAQAFAGTARAGASKTASLVVLDEFALMENQGAVYRAVEPTTMAAVRSASRPGAVFVVVSTARGNRGQFARLYWGSKRGENGWASLFFDVTHNRFLAPEGASEEEFWEAWRAKRLEFGADTHQFYAEYPRNDDEAFRESGRGRFPHVPELSDCPPFEVPAVVVRKGEGFGLQYLDPDVEADVAQLWLSEPLEDMSFSSPVVLAADPSGGVGRDYAAAQLMVADSEVEGGVRIVGFVHRNDLDPVEFGELLNKIGRLFRGPGQRAALLVVERNDNAEGEVIARLRLRHYPNLFRYVARDRVSQRAGSVFGWPINKATKPEAVNALARLLPAVEVEGEMVAAPLLSGIYPELRDELVGYVVVTSSLGRVSMKADGNGHDDLVMSTAIGAAVLERLADKPRVSPSPTKVEHSFSSVGWDPDKYLEGQRKIARKRSLVAQQKERRVERNFRRSKSRRRRRS